MSGESKRVRVLGLGAGGHAKVVLEILALDIRYTVVALLDTRPKLAGGELFGVPIAGDDAMLAQFIAAGVGHFFVGIGGAKSLAPRRAVYERAVASGLEAVAAVHPGAIVSVSARLGRGATVMAGAIINAEARLGANVIVNSGAIVEHDCVLGDHVHVATGARLTGGVLVGEESLIGAGAVVRQGIEIGRRAVVGAGAVVVKDVPDGAMVVGVPAAAIRREGGNTL